MADVTQLQGSVLGTGLSGILMSDDIQPGSAPSYQTCKDIYLYHPLGAKMAEKPVKIALSQERRYRCVEFPGDDAIKAFEETRRKLMVQQAIYSTRVLSKVYGIASLSLMVEGQDPSLPLDPRTFWKRKLVFNVYDPLNTAGSLVLNQDPLSSTFLHAQEISVGGKVFHKSKVRVIMNEFPIYLSYTTSAYGFVGRSVYQRSLYPLKSFIQTMITNDMISLKSGVIVAKVKQVGSAVTNALRAALSLKRNVVKEARVGNVINISADGKEDITSLDMTNISEPFSLARKNIIEDIASGAPMPAKMLTEESFAQGFADGTEDAKEQARYVDGERYMMNPLVEFTDMVCQYVAWNPDWWEEQQRKYPKQLGGMTYEAGFFMLQNSFEAPWPSLLTEPESEQVKVADVKLKAAIAAMQIITPVVDPESAARVIEWLARNINEMENLFGNPLDLDYKKIETWIKAHPKETEETKPSPPSPMALRV
jgi:hypothetical protein